MAPTAARLEPGDIAAVAEWFVHAIDYPARDRTMPPAPPQVARWLVDADALTARRECAAYCSLFDIGKPEPPVPLLESHYHRDGHTRLRRVVNFYRGYGVAQDEHHAPDHACVELAFLAYLARVAALYPLRSDVQDAMRSFARLHPGSFAGRCATALHKHDGSGIYAALFDALSKFLVDVGGETLIRFETVPVDPADAGPAT